jgi:hypothetical protein
LVLYGCVIGISSILYRQAQAGLIPAATKNTTEPELRVTMRFEENEDSDRAADLFGTILRSVRAARARREKEQD